MKPSISRRRFGMVVGVGVAGLAVPREGQAQIVPRTPIIIKSGSLRILSSVELTESGSGPFEYRANLGGPARIDYIDLEDDLDMQPDEQGVGARTAEFTLSRTFAAAETATLAIDASGAVTFTVPQRLTRIGAGGNKFRYRLNKNASAVALTGGSNTGGRFKNAMIVVRTS